MARKYKFLRAITCEKCPAFLQAQLVFEVGQLRGALLLAFPDHGRALRERNIPPAAVSAGGSASGMPGGGAAETPLYGSRHQAWVQVHRSCSFLLCC